MHVLCSFVYLSRLISVYIHFIIFACFNFLYFVYLTLFCYIDCFPVNPGLAIPKELGVKLYKNFKPLHWYSPNEALCNLVNCGNSMLNLKPNNFKNKYTAKLRVYFISGVGTKLEIIYWTENSGHISNLNAASDQRNILLSSHLIK